MEFAAELDFPCHQMDGCKSLKVGECPIQIGEEIDFEISFSVEENHPKVRIFILKAYSGLKSERKSHTVCLKGWN